MPPGTPLRRAVLVLLLYALGAWVVLLLGGWLRRVLVLPMLFDELLRAVVYLGAFVAAVLAWHYPRLAGGSGDDNGSSPSSGGRRR